MASKPTSKPHLFLSLNLLYFIIFTTSAAADPPSASPPLNPPSGGSVTVPIGNGGWVTVTNPRNGGGSVTATNPLTATNPPRNGGGGGVASPIGSGGGGARTGNCPRDAVKLGVCANVVGDLVKVVVGDPPAAACCSLLAGLVDLEAAVCLCTVVRANVAGIDVSTPLNLLLDLCGRTPPIGFTCYGQLIPIVAVSLTIFFHIVSSFAEKAPYTSFAKNATSAPATGYYDYIIIGGGTAGCPLAATLSASAKVLLLERGGLPYDNPNITHLNGFTNSLEDSSDTSPAQLFISTDGVFNHRGRVLGGGSGINAGFFSRASTEYVRQVGWDPKLVNESYAWVDRKTVFQPRLSTWQAAVRGGLLEAGVLPDNGFTFEHLVGTKTGGSIFDENGTRHTSADLLEYADPTNIIVYLHATAHQILFKTSPRQKDKAYGVVFRDSNHTAYLKNALKNEIILSAGAIGSPQLLMLSGIGPGTKLKSLGIDVVLNQPNEYLGRKLLGTSLVQVAGITDFGVFFEAGSGLMTSLFRTPQSPSSKDVGIVLQKVSGPFSTGYTELVSNVNPNVTFNYYNDSRDLQKCIRGMKIMQRVIESQSLSEYRYNNTSFESLRRYVLAHPINFRKKHDSAASNSDQYCKDTVMTIWHYHGGCHVNRVVDHDYRVIGLDSIFNYSPGTNPQATLMMLGRYMGRKILQQRPTVK